MKNTVRFLVVFVVFVGVFAFLDEKEEQPQKKNFVIPKQLLPGKAYTFQDALQAINKADMKENLYYLTSDKLEGRMSGKIGNTIAAEFIAAEFRRWGLEPVKGSYFQKFNISRANPGPKNETGDNFTNNVVGFLPGNDPVLKEQIIVVGAHMDHIGYGPRWSMYGGGKIHPGADDNASGTVLVLEVARSLGMVKEKLKRSVLMMAFSGEEMGLLGARYYVSNPLFPKENHIIMINQDMIGRMRNGHVGIGSSSETARTFLRKIVVNYPSVSVRIGSGGSGGSDHAAFNNAGIPIVMAHTGQHSDYHTPGDTANKINYDGLEKVTKIIFELTWKFATEDLKLLVDKPVQMKYTHDHDWGKKFPEID